MPHYDSYRFFNGPIVTMDPDEPVVGEVVTHAHTIAWMGRRGDAPSKHRRARPIDLNGRLLIPAFSDAHTHFLYFATSLHHVDLRGVTTLRAALRRIAGYAKAHPSKRDWVTGKGLDVNSWGGCWPSRRDLDKILPGRPAAFFTHDEHSLWVNSAALRRCGITKDTIDPGGGRIMRDGDGEPSGIFQETACELIHDKIPEPTLRQKQRFVQQAQKLAHAQGVVAIGDMGEPETLTVFNELKASSKLQIRLWKSIPMNRLDAAIESGLESGMGNRWIKIGAVKLFLDGALGSSTAWMLKPYRSDRKNTGVCRLELKEFESIVRKATSNGLSVCVHAIGDAAVRRAIDVLTKYRNRFPQCQPPRIEHVQVIAAEDIQRLADAGIIASMQPSHLLTDRDYADRHWGNRSRLAFALRSFWDAGARLAFGSDVPIEALSPIAGIGAAVYRSRPKDLRGSWTPKQRLSPWEALWGFTAGAALAAGDQDQRGMIRPGCLADLAVLDRNIITARPKDIFRTQVAMTFVDGRRVYNRDK